MTLLRPGDPFPTLTVALAEGRALRLPDALAGTMNEIRQDPQTSCVAPDTPTTVMRRNRSMARGSA